MSLQRRAALLAWAERRGGVITRTTTTASSASTGRPLDPLQEPRSRGRVIYVGSFSKVMLPTLRLGFLIAPASLQPALRTAKRLTDWHGELRRRRRSRASSTRASWRATSGSRRGNTRRHAQIVEAMQREFNTWLRVIPSAAGLHIAAWVARGASDRSRPGRAPCRGVGSHRAFGEPPFRGQPCASPAS